MKDDERGGGSNSLMLDEIKLISDMLRRGGLIELTSSTRCRSVDGHDLSAVEKRNLIISVAATAGSVSYRRGDEDERECMRTFRGVHAALDDLRDAINRRYETYPYALYDLKPPRSSRLTDVTDAIALLVLALNPGARASEISLDAAGVLSPLRSMIADGIAAQEWALSYIDNDDR